MVDIEAFCDCCCCCCVDDDNDDLSLTDFNTDVNWFDTPPLKYVRLESPRYVVMSEKGIIMSTFVLLLLLLLLFLPMSSSSVVIELPLKLADKSLPDCLLLLLLFPARSNPIGLLFTIELIVERARAAAASSLLQLSLCSLLLLFAGLIAVVVGALDELVVAVVAVGLVPAVDEDKNGERRLIESRSPSSAGGPTIIVGSLVDVVVVVVVVPIPTNDQRLLK